MPYLNKEKKAERTREYRKEAVLKRLYICTNCQHAFQTSFSLKRHEKALVCPNLDMSTPSALIEESNPHEVDVQEEALPDNEYGSDGLTREERDKIWRDFYNTIM